MFRNCVLYLVLAVVLAACSAVANVQPQALSSYAGPRGTDGPYILRPNDHVRLKAYNDDLLTDEYEIDSNGYVSIPLVGRVKAAGLTTRQLEQRLDAQMKGKLAQKPEISIEIATYAPFYIYGEVKKAGEYPFRPGLTVADAIAIAGGLTYRANENQIYVRRAGRPTEQTVALDQRVPIFPGDNIRVSERMF
ncbi:MAG TPA: polysaccharide biosynthesis/export family protein [Pseudolabrys sp.]|nr:polysaccharide biosynthesis/export family protein [Pseudolabrys sp.]